MNLSVGIVGLPNVGKSTLFNALLKKQQALAANYPFATIEPNVGIVPVPDERLEVLADIVVAESIGHLGGAHSVTPEESLLPPSEVSKRRPPIKPAVVQFVDIAGLVKGASEGAGLGNKFLSHIREVQIIAHVVRAFADEDVIKEGSVDPKTDYETIQTELIIADLQTIENSKLKAQSSKQQLKTQNEAIGKLSEILNKGIPARDAQLTDEEKDAVRNLFLLSKKPEIIVLNVSESDYNPKAIEEITQKYKEMLNQVQHDKNDNMIVICAKIESELSELSEEEQKQYLKDLGLEQSGLERLIQKAYETLGLISFLTCGEKEVRAWTIKRGTNAQNAAGVIHNDFMQHFIKAEVISFADFVAMGGWKKARELGKARMEGRDYIMKDGDVVEFKIGS